MSTLDLPCHLILNTTDLDDTTKVADCLHALQGLASQGDSVEVTLPEALTSTDDAHEVLSGTPRRTGPSLAAGARSSGKRPAGVARAISVSASKGVLSPIMSRMSQAIVSLACHRYRSLYVLWLRAVWLDPMPRCFGMPRVSLSFVSLQGLSRSPTTSAHTQRLTSEVTRLQDELEACNDAKAILSARQQRTQEQLTRALQAEAKSEEARKHLADSTAHLHESVRQLQDAVATANAAIATEAAKASELERLLAACRKELEEAKAGIAAGEAAVGDATIRATMAEEAAAAARVEADAAASRADEASRLLAEARSEKELLEETLQTQAEEHEGHQTRAATALAEVSARAQSRSARAATLVKRCAAAHGAIRSAGEGMRSLAAEVRAETSAASADLLRMGKQLVLTAGQLQTDAAEANRRFMRETRERRRAFNQLQELKGNIRVFARVRPLLGAEAAGGAKEVVEATSDFDLAVASPEGASSAATGAGRAFSFDRVFGSSSTQVEVYDEIAPVVMSAMDGFHVCIFAYGQTGSGKTFTMQGPDSDRGVYQRALEQIFEETHSRRDSHDFTITVSMVEIYNEAVHDLLCEADAAATAAAASSHTSSSTSASSSCASTLSGASAGAGGRVLELKQGAEGIYMPGVTTEAVVSATAIQALMRRGERCRSVGKTNANEHSSRSHSLLLIDVAGRSKVTGASTKGRLVLVDLAGSERVSKSGAAGQRMKEAQAINKSLSALGDVIGALTHKSAHIPYRNSKLTYLLQDSLGKDNKALMIVQVSPVPDSRSESVCSLNFASRVRKVEQGKARAHGESAESSKLKAALREAKESGKAQAELAEQLRQQLKESQERRDKASEKLKAVEATADRADAAKATLAKAKASAQKDLETLRSQVVEARKAAAAEKARADRLAAELGKAKDEARAASRSAHERSGSASRKAREAAEAASSAAVSRALAKERGERGKAVAAAVKEAEAKAKAAADKAAAAATAQAERELQAERARRQALEARLRKMIAAGGAGAGDAAAPGSRVRRAQSAGAAPTPCSGRSAVCGGAGSATRGAAASGSSGPRVRGGTAALVRSRGSDSRAKAGDTGFDSGEDSDDSGVVSFRSSARKAVARGVGSKTDRQDTAAVPPSCDAIPPPLADPAEPDWSESPVQAVRLAVDEAEEDDDSSREAEADASLCAGAMMLNDTFELRKARGGKGFRAKGEQLLDEEDEGDGDAGSDVLGGISLAIDDDDDDDDDADADAEEGGPGEEGVEEGAVGGACATPGGKARLVSAKRTRLGTPAAAPAAARSMPRSIASAAPAAGDSDDSGDDEDEFRSADAVFGGKPALSEAASAAREPSVHARWAPGSALTVGTPEQMSSAPSYAERHEHGKSPFVKGILKRKPGVSASRTGRSAVARSAIAQTVTKAAGSSATKPACAAPMAPAAPLHPPSSTAAFASAPKPHEAPATGQAAVLSRSSNSVSASSATKPVFSAGKSTSALLGSILRKSSRASVILGRTGRSNSARSGASLSAARKHSHSASRVAPSSGTTAAEGTGPRAARAARAGLADATARSSSAGDSVARWR